MSGFVEAHELRDATQHEAAREVLARAGQEGLSLIRLAFPDQHGVLRGKAVTAAALPAALSDGVSLTSTMLLKDTSHRTVVPVFSAGGGIGLRDVQGAADFLLVPDPSTFRVLPWAPGTGWMLCDAHWPDGLPIMPCMEIAST